MKTLQEEKLLKQEELKQLGDLLQMQGTSEVFKLSIQKQMEKFSSEMSSNEAWMSHHYHYHEATKSHLHRICDMSSRFFSFHLIKSLRLFKTQICALDQCWVAPHVCFACRSWICCTGFLHYSLTISMCSRRLTFLYSTGDTVMQVIVESDSRDRHGSWVIICVTKIWRRGGGGWVGWCEHLQQYLIKTTQLKWGLHSTTKSALSSKVLHSNGANLLFQSAIFKKSASKTMKRKLRALQNWFALKVVCRFLRNSDT